MERTESVSALTLFVAALFIINCGNGGGDGGNESKIQKTAFYTSTAGNADFSTWPEVSGLSLTGLDAADAICQARADAAGLDGTFVAWISDDNDDAYCRVHGLTGKKSANCGQAELPATAGPWFRTDGTPFADRIDLLTSSYVIYSPMRHDEFGSSFDTVFNYWTATDSAGVLDGENCSNWTDSTASGVSISIGRTSHTVHQWTYQFESDTCQSDNSLLCLRLGANDILPNPQAQGKKVFLTSVMGKGSLGDWTQSGGNTGIAAGDAICRNLAAAAGLANADSFKAWLSDSSTDARDRLTSDGPWARLDGMMVAESKSALLNSWLNTSVSVTENGDYVGSLVWTGTSEGGTMSSEVCSDWTNSSDSAAGLAGQSNDSNAKMWTHRNYPPCFNSERLYCFED
jgi:hypothetical protein